MIKKTIYDLPLVSVTIPTKNEEANLARCLASLKKQTYPQEKIEIIVVDNNSIDKTKQVAKKYTDKIFTKGPERSAQRNFGMIKKSKGKYLIYLDADMSLGPKTIEKAVEKLVKSKIIALYIPEIVVGDSYWSQVRSFERSFYDGTVIDCVRFIIRDAFIKSGGFDLSLTGPEDWDLDKKIKNLGQVDLLDENEAVIYHHQKKLSLTKYLSKKRYYSQSMARYIKKWGQNDPDLVRQFGLWYRYFGVFFEKGKWKRLIRKPILAMGMFFLRIAIGIIYLADVKKE